MPTPARRRPVSTAGPAEATGGTITDPGIVDQGPDAAPVVMTYPSTGTIDFPDGRHVRITQADEGHRPEFFLTDPGEDERPVADDELHDLLFEANALNEPADPEAGP